MIERTTTFHEGDQQLAGTLCLPEPGVERTSGGVAGVVILTGSGPLDRDGSHKKLPIDVSRQLAHALARVGVASLRYDKRGVGESPGDWMKAGLYDNVADARAAVAHLREQAEVDAEKVSILGHSEGAVLAGAVAADDPSLAGAVLLSGAARSGRDVLRWQAEVLVPTLPAPVRGLLRLLRVDPVAKVSANHDKLLATTGDVARLGGVKVNAKWFREFLLHDPAADLARITAPVLAITGEKDLQVPPSDLPVIAERAAGVVSVHEIADLTHTLRRQEGEASLKKYKAEVRQPVDAEVVELVCAWVTA